jgi:hypothetical protein
VANYVYIENSEILEYYDLLPINWRNISNFYTLESDSEYMASLGWYKVIKANIPTFDSSRQRMTNPTYTFDGTEVTEIVVIEDIYESEEAYRSAMKTQIVDHIRQRRDNLFKDCDWTQLSDIQSVQTQEWIDSWKIYRQALRDLPEVYMNNDVYNVNDIIWPEIPYAK